MQPHASFDNLNSSKIKSFFKKISAISDSYSDKEQDISKYGIEAKKFAGPYNKAEYALRSRVQELEEQLSKTSEERDSALEENRRRIDQLNITLLSVRENLEKLRKSKERKEKRIRQLEEKIDKNVKVRSHISRH
jgi:chromosome segregation ATPase